MAVRPRVILHVASSVDGRTDRVRVNPGAFYALARRLGEDATLAGSSTILAGAPDVAHDPPDRPPPPAGGGAGRPLLVVCDSRGRVRDWGPLRASGFWGRHVALASESTPRAHLDSLARQGVETIIAGDDRVDLRVALAELSARHHVQAVRVDSGGVLNGVLLRERLVDELSIVLHPCAVGGSTPGGFLRGPDDGGPGEPVQLVPLGFEKLEAGTVWLRYAVAGA